MPPNPLSLKQRLAALSANINSPRSNSFDAPPDSPMSPISGKRKSFFKQPFGRMQTTDPGPSDYYGQERIQEVMNRLIFQAGVDYECVFQYFYSGHAIDRNCAADRTRPMYVACSRRPSSSVHH